MKYGILKMIIKSGNINEYTKLEMFRMQTRIQTDYQRT